MFHPHRMWAAWPAWMAGRGGHRGRDPFDMDGRGRGGFGDGGRGFGRAGRVFGPGDLRLVLLALIAERPSSGYELIKELEQRFGGVYAPSPGSVYPTLTLLEEQGHIRAAGMEGAKRSFEITEEGRAFLQENRPMVDAVLNRMNITAQSMSGRATPGSVHQAMHTLRAALAFHSRGWDEAETRRVLDVLEKAARDISGG
ncbi:PadR family transcriptional regulator [Pigmentiphaga sp. GD03639]|uniref:PadR family transcriptional regulator n=1 Tax=Pigmentiphaga sp. GD03639 TaxID=2975354 RepID=UPI00244C3D29|nr:PadR family transcriptional regulator [Pigmentiphaga sp. GD03639]MDH2235059.1 PadR family transcriptional regulator [Pigmentiphaga sp. GD03639]